MMRQVMVLGLVLLVAAPASAATVDQQEFQGLVDEVLSMMPDAVASLVGDQRVNIHIQADPNATIDEDQTIGIEMKKLNITSWQDEPLDNATMEVWVNASTVEELILSDDRRSVLKEAIKDGDIEYEAYGLFNIVTVGVVRLFVRVLLVVGLL